MNKNKAYTMLQIYNTCLKQASILFCHIFSCFLQRHNEFINWKHFPRYWSFVRGIHWSPVNSPHKGQWCGALMFCLICAWINARVNNRGAGDLRRHRAHYDVIGMTIQALSSLKRRRLTGMGHKTSGDRHRFMMGIPIQIRSYLPCEYMPSNLQ